MKRATVEFFHTRDCPHWTGGGYCPQRDGVICPDGEIQAPPDDCPLPDIGNTNEGPAGGKLMAAHRKHIGYISVGWCSAARAIVTGIPLKGRNTKFREALEDAAGAIVRAEDALREEFVPQTPENGG